MAVSQYKRPNLTPAQAEIVCDLLKREVAGLEPGTEEFDTAYGAFLKVRDAKLIGTGKLKGA